MPTPMPTPISMHDQHAGHDDDPPDKDIHEPHASTSAQHPHYVSPCHDTLKTFAGVAGNVLEWYDFAVFGFFSDILGMVFFSKDQSEDLRVMESFAVFGGAFLMRPVGGIVIGYIGDVQGRKKALEISIFLMAIATSAMGCLPTYEQVGPFAIVLLVLVRMLQGMSVGGQLMSSLVFTLEGHPHRNWGLYGSFVLAGANFGTFLGGIVAYYLRHALTDDQLLRWGWRLPFLSGILVSLSGFYLKYYCKEDEIHGHGGGHVSIPTEERHAENPHNEDLPSDEVQPEEPEVPFNPIKLAFARGNRRNLLASAMVPLLWSGGFYLSFVWMAIYMTDLIDPPVPGAFGVNSVSLLLIGIWFPIAGWLSDRAGRRRIMTIGAVSFAGMGPLLIIAIGQSNGNAWIAFTAQTILGIAIALFGAPMCAWLVETFDPASRLTSVAIGYNVAQAIGGGTSPFVATLLVDKLGERSPGILLVVLGCFSLVGLWCMAPSPPEMAAATIQGNKVPEEDDGEHPEEGNFSLELKEIT